MKYGWILEAILRIGHVLEAKTPAAKLSLDERCSLVYDAIRTRFGTKDEGGYYSGAYPVATYDDYVIFRRSTAGKSTLWQIGYSWNADGQVEFAGEPVAVVQTYKPLKEAQQRDERIPNTLQEAAGERLESFRVEAEILGPIAEGESAATGREWDVILIREGMSKNRNRYTRQTLAEAVALYENRPQFIDHKLSTGPFGRSGTEVVGFTKNLGGVVLHEANSPKGTFAIAARACIVEEAFAKKLLAAHAMGNPTLFGLSHDVRAESVTATQEDGAFYDVKKIRAVESTDWVLTPAAGGRLVRLVASDTPNPQLQEDARMLKELIEALKAAGVTVPENCDEVTASRLLRESLARTATPAPGAVAAATRTTEGAQPAAGQVVEATALATLQAEVAAMRAREAANAGTFAQMMIERSLAECSLPEPFKARIRKRFSEAITAGKIPTDGDVAQAIKESVEDVGALREANLIMPHVGAPRADVVKGRAEKVQEQLAEFFDPTKSGFSFKEMYVGITGDTKVNGRITPDVRARLSESLGVHQESLTSSSFDQILGDSITRRMLKDYAAVGLAQWRGTIGEVVPLSDFRTVRRMRFGGYGNLPIVGQGAPYASMNSPTDEEATYAPAKRGGTEQITLEMIKNDDVGVIRRIPSKLARAAAQTLHEFVWDLLANNSAIYDAVALAAVGHSNLVTTALSSSNIASLRLKIKQQADMSNGKRLGLSAKYLIVPSELEELAFQLTTSDRVLGSNNNDPNFVKKLSLETIVVEYWTDTNNYWITASVDQAPMIEIGFLDGQENPELFVQDMPSVGSMFSNDQLTYKLKHTYGGAVMDYRPFSAGIVP